MATSVGLREFRASLAEYVASDAPVAVTKHGRTVGFFIPVKQDLRAEIAAFKASAAKLDDLLIGKDLDDVLAEFDAARRAARA
jgi:antitoxin (DNA-binding transcriptional repressor) of toxin-antitoxin stability system